MRERILLLMVLLCTGFFTWGQAPEGIKYQAVARNSSGEVFANQTLSVQIKLLKGNPNGNPIYQEIHEVKTNKFGLFSLVIGQGEPHTGSFQSIEWGSDRYYAEIGIDPEGGDHYTMMGSSPLLSVPYAFFSNQTGNTEDADADPANELQEIWLKGDSLNISGGNAILLPYGRKVWEKANENIYYLSGNVGVGVKKTNSRLEVRGDEASTGKDTLFAVKDKDGNTVFAVFPDGAKVYVDETSKGIVGGFAVSGRAATKSGEQEYMKVTPDSTRIFFKPTGKGMPGGFAVSGRSATKQNLSERIFFANSDSTRFYINDRQKGMPGGFAVSGRAAGKGTAADYFNISANAAVNRVEPSRPQVLWYPKKEAFLAGRVLVESPDSIGTNSMATGFESKAIGDYSQAFGYKARTMGNHSTAIGNYASTKGTNSFALGDSARAEAHASFAIGDKAISRGIGSYAIGSVGRDTASNRPAGHPALAEGDYSFAIGLGTRATQKSAFAIGNHTLASGPFSMATGLFTEASGIFSTSMGFRTTAKGRAALAFGAGAKATGHYSLAMGGVPTREDPFTIASGISSIAIGNGSEARGDFAMAIGNSSTAIGKYSVALGRLTASEDTASLAMGFNTQALENYTTAMGNHTIASGYSATAMGENTEASGDFSIAMGQSCIADGAASIAMGNSTIASGEASMAMGIKTSATKPYAFAIGSESKATATGSYVAGNKSTASGIGSRAWGPHLHVSGDNSLGISLGVKMENDLPTTIEVPNANVMAIMNGNVGIGISSPANKLDIAGSMRVQEGNITVVEGNISVTGGDFLDDGTTLEAPDYVFEEDYQLESIEEHAKFMWEEKHLPALQSAEELKNGQTYRMAERREQILEELEKAHIYIEQLNNKIKELQSENKTKQEIIEQQDKAIKQLKEDVDQIKQYIKP